MRSKWKLPVVNYFYKKLILNSNYNNKLIFLKNGASVIFKSLIGFIFRIYNGHLFYNILITKRHLGFKFGSFITTKKLGSNIHINKIKKQKILKKKRGHLVNPVSVRLGHFYYWNDLWFVKQSYYAQFLHNVLLLRNLVEFFFFSSELEKCGIIYSHLKIAKMFNYYIICIYIYNSKLENILYNFSKNSLVFFKGFIEYYLKYKFFILQRLNFFRKFLKSDIVIVNNNNNKYYYYYKEIIENLKRTLIGSCFSRPDFYNVSPFWKAVDKFLDLFLNKMKKLLYFKFMEFRFFSMLSKVKLFTIFSGLNFNFFFHEKQIILLKLYLLKFLKSMNYFKNVLICYNEAIAYQEKFTGVKYKKKLVANFAKVKIKPTDETFLEVIKHYYDLLFHLKLYCYLRLL